MSTISLSGITIGYDDEGSGAPLPRTIAGLRQFLDSLPAVS
jgi:hypothetical protein